MALLSKTNLQKPLFDTDPEEKCAVRKRLKDLIGQMTHVDPDERCPIRVVISVLVLEGGNY